MECAAMATYYTLQLWLGRAYRMTDLARGNGVTQESIQQRIDAVDAEIRFKEEFVHFSDKVENELREARIRKYRLMAVQETKEQANGVPDYDTAYRFQMLSEFHESLMVSSEIGHTQELLNEANSLLKDKGLVTVEPTILWSKMESYKSSLRSAAERVFLNPRSFWTWSLEDGVWKSRVMEMVLNEETFKFEFRVYDSMAAQGRSEVLLKFEVLNFCLLHQFGPEKQVEIPVTTDGENRTEKVYLISLRPRCPVIDPKFSTNRPLVRNDGKLTHLHTWTQSPDIELEGAATDYKHNLLIGCSSIKHRDQLTTKILRAGARYAFAVGFSDWGVEPYNYQNIKNALKQCRKGDMIRLRGHYTVYNEQVVVSKACSIVGDGDCMIVNRQTQNQPSVVVLASADDVFFSNVGVRSSMDYSTDVMTKRGNFNKNESGSGGYVALDSNQDAKVFGNGAIEVLYGDTSEKIQPKAQVAPGQKAKTSHLGELEKAYADSLKPPPKVDKVSKFDTLFPITTLILHVESLTCPGQISMHQDGDNEEEIQLIEDTQKEREKETENIGWGGRVILHGVTVTDSLIGVYVHNKAEAILRKCSISMCRDSGLIVAEGGRADCHRCQISNNQQWGVAVYGEATFNDGQIQPSEVKLFETMVQRNQSTGVACWDRGHVTMVNSTSCMNSGAGFDITAKEIRWPASYDEGRETDEREAAPDTGVEEIRWSDFVHKFDADSGSNSMLAPWHPKTSTNRTLNPLSCALLRENSFFDNKANGVVINGGSSVMAAQNYSYGNRGKQFLVDHGCVFNHRILSDGGWRFSHASHLGDVNTDKADPPAHGGNVSASGPGSALLVHIHVSCLRSPGVIKGMVEDMARFMLDACPTIASKFHKLVQHESVDSVHPEFLCKHVHHLLSSVDEAVRTGVQIVQAVVEMDFVSLKQPAANLAQDEMSDEEDFYTFLFNVTTAAIQDGLQRQIDLKYPSDVPQPFLLEKVQIVGTRELKQYREVKDAHRLRNEGEPFAHINPDGSFKCLCAVATPADSVFESEHGAVAEDAGGRAIFGLAGNHGLNRVLSSLA